MILRSPQRSKQQRWGFEGAVDILLPDAGRWRYGECEIFVNNYVHNVVDTFSFEDVAHAAVAVNEECVIARAMNMKTGGSMDIGSQMGFYVVLGEVWRVENSTKDD